MSGMLPFMDVRALQEPSQHCHCNRKSNDDKQCLVLKEDVPLSPIRLVAETSSSRKNYFIALYSLHFWFGCCAFLTWFSSDETVTAKVVRIGRLIGSPTAPSLQRCDELMPLDTSRSLGEVSNASMIHVALSVTADRELSHRWWIS
jgi:hypothetical protein